MTSLAFESEAGPDLVGCLVEVLRVQGSTEAKGDAGAEFDVVRESSNTAVIDLGLSHHQHAWSAFPRHQYGTHLRERARVKLILGRHLQADITPLSRIPCRLCASLNLRIDLVVITRGENTQVVRGRYGRRITPRRVSRSQRILRDRGFSDIIATLSAD